MDNQKRISGSRAKKRKFKGNQYTITEAKRLSSSGKKLDSAPIKSEASNFHGYVLIDKANFFSALENCLCCSKCFAAVKIDSQILCGISEKISVSCTNCGVIFSSGKSAINGKTQKSGELNSRFLYAMRCLGQGLSGARTFCGLMDMPPPVCKTTYNKIMKSIEKKSCISAEKSMATAALAELQQTENAGMQIDITVSGDGTWKTRGHSSLIGVCTLVGAQSGKVIDAEVLSTRCKGCENWKGVRKGVLYEAWKNDHSATCEKNHKGSAGMMEVVGMNRIFQRSESKRNVRYTNYIGDGDCKTFAALEKAQPYGTQCKISKIECVGHIQKRMGSRLRKRKAEFKGKKLSDGKTLNGKGRLTDALIDKLTVYYGNAIRGNCMSVKDMQKAVWAIFYHKRSTDKEPLHDFCPKGENSWCPFQKALACGEDYLHINSVPAAVMDAIKDIFQDLSMPTLLKKCVGGHTQNSNESLNALIWKFCPKTSGSGKKIVQIAVNEAIMCYNEGQHGRLVTMREMNFQIGRFCASFATESDKTRINAAEMRAQASTLEARRAKKRAKTESEEALKLQEGSVYAPGEF